MEAGNGLKTQDCWHGLKSIRLQKQDCVDDV